MATILLSDADYLRRQAERCGDLAAITADASKRVTFLSLAGVYRELAEELHREGGKRAGLAA